jgi:hypothetical protein
MALDRACRTIGNTGQKVSNSIMKLLSRAVIFAICFSLAATISHAQQMIHAVSGTITTIHPKIQMTDVETDDGSAGSFQWTKPGISMNFDKVVSADATAADKFTALQAHVIVYYYYIGDVRTVVALHDVGTGPFVNSIGKIVKLDRREHLLTIQNGKGGEETFTIDAKTVADTETGVVTNFKFDYNKGVQVHVLATQANGSQTALLIAPII